MKLGLWLVAVLLPLGACGLMRPNPPNELTPAGQRVRLVERAADVAGCVNLGTISARAASVFGKVDLAEDQAVMARNKAAKMGGNAIVKSEAALQIQEPGGQTFTVYLCETK
jgi:hypothetical protein